MRVHDPLLDRLMPNVIGGVVGAMIAGAILLVLLFSDVSGKQAQNCQETEQVKTGLRETLTEAEAFVVSSPVRSEREKALAIQFYADALGRLRPRKC